MSTPVTASTPRRRPPTPRTSTPSWPPRAGGASTRARSRSGCPRRACGRSPRSRRASRATATRWPCGTARSCSSVRFADFPFMAKMTRWGIDAHMGVLFGWPNQLLLLLLGGGLVALVVMGYRMWWKRRPTRGFGRPTPRGQWRKAPPVALVALGVGAVVVGWFAPLLGISLVAFLVVDALLGLRGEEKTAAS
ncbi:PepSY domain-containing protein [Lentzea chajnantorensis]